jgi:ribonuclease BN (tRNA processing enzyme)
MCLLIDKTLAIDTGCLTSCLSLEEQQALGAILLPHAHYDHVRDIPAIGMNRMLRGKPLDVFSIEPVFQQLRSHLLNDELYPDFFRKPESGPSLRPGTLVPGETRDIAGCRVTPVPMKHSIPAVGYQVQDAEGRTMLYTGDTGSDSPEKWEKVHPDLLIIEVTAPDAQIDFANKSGHLTPSLLLQELEGFRRMKGYLPRIITVHMNPLEESVIRLELEAVGSQLKTAIELAHEGMRVTV